MELLTPDDFAVESEHNFELLQPDDFDSGHNGDINGRHDAPNAQMNSLHQQLRAECQQHLDEIARLKRYIGFDPALIEAQQQALERTNGLLKARIEALESLLRIQEEAVTQSTTDPRVEHDPSDISMRAVAQDPVRAQYLLARWRQQVFAMLLQQSANQDAHQQRQHRFQAQLEEYRQDSARMHQDLRVKEQTINTMGAQLDLVVAENESYQQKQMRQEDTITQLLQETDRLGNSHLVVHTAVEMSAKAFASGFARLASGQQQLNLMLRRLTFAADRLKTVQAAFARKHAQRQPPEGTDPAVTIDNLEANIAQLRDEATLTQQQLAELQRERSFLLNENSALQASFQQRLDQRIAAERAKLAEAESLLQAKTQELDRCQRELNSNTEALAKRDETIAELRQQLAQARADHAQATAELKHQHESQMREANGQATEEGDRLRNELAKVHLETGQLKVQLKQAERRLEASTERLTSEFELERLQLRAQADTLQQQLHDAKQELASLQAQARAQQRHAYLAAPPLASSAGKQPSRPSPSAISSRLPARRPLPIDRYGLHATATQPHAPSPAPDVVQAPASSSRLASEVNRDATNGAEEDVQGLMQEIADVTNRILSGMDPE
eukprot:TRINITY_DN7644_c0_g2_i1.p1 TRINITY_DN7644_c0_g2~~TRINITY_DN7644_c0_g2_i1.p1  ORF type:complete len:617 (+),score=152.44 TRINITY_DN7644_c0_g2_i1:247-2097(+)